MELNKHDPGFRGRLVDRHGGPPRVCPMQVHDEPIAFRLRHEALSANDVYEATAIGVVLGGDGEGWAGRPHETGRGSLVEEGAPVDHDQPVADLLELTEDVGRHQDRPLAVSDPADELSHVVDPGGVEAVGRLVQDEQLGITEERRGEAEPLLHAERVLTESIRCSLAEPYQVQHVWDLGNVMTGEGRDDPEVLGPGEPGPEGR